MGAEAEEGTAAADLALAVGAVGRWRGRLERAVSRLRTESDLVAEASRLVLEGSLLLAASRSIPRGARSARVQDPQDPEGPGLEIPLDPARGAAEQARARFPRAARLRREAEGLVARRAALAAELAEAGLWIERLAAWKTLLVPTDPDAPHDREAIRARRRATRELERGCAQLRERLLPRGLWPQPPRRRGEGPGKAPVRWDLPGGWILWAGRDGAENDLLTTRIARPDDLWFHVADLPGAHVVLRSPDGRSGRPGEELVRRAAEVAAWLSRARAQEQVLVRWCEKRHVRKPRGAKPGAVLQARSSTVRVRPAPPPREGEV